MTYTKNSSRPTNDYVNIITKLPLPVHHELVKIAAELSIDRSILYAVILTHAVYYSNISIIEMIAKVSENKSKS